MTWRRCWKQTKLQPREGLRSLMLLRGLDYALWKSPDQLHVHTERDSSLKHVYDWFILWAHRLCPFQPIHSSFVTYARKKWAEWVPFNTKVKTSRAGWGQFELLLLHSYDDAQPMVLLRKIPVTAESPKETRRASTRMFPEMQNVQIEITWLCDHITTSQWDSLWDDSPNHVFLPLTG